MKILIMNLKMGTILMYKMDSYPMGIWEDIGMNKKGRLRVHNNRGYRVLNMIDRDVFRSKR